MHNIVPYPLLTASTQQCLPVDCRCVPPVWRAKFAQHSVIPIVDSKHSAMLSVDSTGVFHQCGGARCAQHSAIPTVESKHSAMLSVDSTGVFHQCGGARCAQHSAIPTVDSKHSAMFTCGLYRCFPFVWRGKVCTTLCHTHC